MEAVEASARYFIVKDGVLNVPVFWLSHEGQYDPWCLLHGTTPCPHKNAVESLYRAQMKAFATERHGDALVAKEEADA